MIEVLFKDDQVARYKLLKHSDSGIFVEYDGCEVFIPHSGYQLYKKDK